VALTELSLHWLSQPPLVDLLAESILLYKLLSASKFDESAYASSGIFRNMIYSEKFEITY
jgi:hypothetical protein